MPTSCSSTSRTRWRPTTRKRRAATSSRRSAPTTGRERPSASASTASTPTGATATSSTWWKRAAQMLDTVLVPKVGSPVRRRVRGDAAGPDRATQRLEPGRIGIHILIETAAGMANVEAISRARPDRLEAMVFGVADYAASVRARTTNIGGANPGYSVLTDPLPQTGAREIHWGDQWHFGISRMVAACRAEGLRPIDGPFGDSTTRTATAALPGAPRRWAARANGRSTRRRSSWRTRSSPLARRRSTARAGSSRPWRTQRRRAKGAVSLDGRLIDAASIRMAENLIRQVEQITTRS